MYDNLPINQQGTHPGRSMHRWQVPVNEVDQAKRDTRILDSSVELILEACGQYPPLPEPVQMQKVKEYQATGSLEVRNELVLHNLRYVVSVAKFMRPYMDLPASEMNELIQLGVIGFMKAVEKYDPDHSSAAKLTTFARYSMLQTMFNNYNNDTNIKMPSNTRSAVMRVGKHYYSLKNSLKRAPSDEELADAAGVSLSKLKDLQHLIFQPLSLDAFVGQEDDGEWNTRINSVISDEESFVEKVEERDNRRILVNALENLSYRERRVLELRFGLGGETPRTLDDVGRTFNVTRERIRGIENTALKRLQSVPEAGILRNQLLHSSEEEHSTRMRQNWWSNYHSTHPAYEARRKTEKLVRAKKQLEAVELAREAKDHELAMLDDKFETFMTQRALADKYTADKPLFTRNDFFGQYGEDAPQLTSELVEPYWIKAFRHSYGYYASAVADALYEGLSVMATNEGSKYISLTSLEDHIAEYDDSLYGVNGQYLKQIFKALEQAGMICAHPENDSYFRIRRQGDTQQIPFDREAIEYPDEIDDASKRLLHAAKVLGMGIKQPHGITHDELLNHVDKLNLKDQGRQNENTEQDLEYLVDKNILILTFDPTTQERTYYLGTGQDKE